MWVKVRGRGKVDENRMRKTEMKTLENKEVLFQALFQP